jgi:hypothetical protein
MNVITEQRTPTWTERIQLGVAVLATIAGALPMVLADLKPLLPEHYFGILSAIAPALLAITAWMQYPRPGKIVAMKPVDEVRT